MLILILVRFITHTKPFATVCGYVLFMAIRVIPVVSAVSRPQGLYFHLSDGAFIRLTNRICSLPATTRQFHSRAHANYNLQFLILRNTKLHGLTSYFNGFPKTIPTHVSLVNRLNNIFGLYLLKLSENVNYGNYGGKR